MINAENKTLIKLHNERADVLNNLKWTLQEVKDITEKLYELNASISLIFIATKQEPTKKDMMVINETLGEIIKTLRKVVEK